MTEQAHTPTADLGTPPEVPAPRGLGRLYAPDTRDRAYLLTPDRLADIPRQLEPGARRRQFAWKRGPVLNQGSTSECTVFTAAGFLQSAPQLHSKGLGWARDMFTNLYRAAQRIDEWPGEGYDGTSFRAVMKMLSDPQGPLGQLISEYLWVTDEDMAREYLMTRGTLAFGTDWFAGMDNPTAKGAYIEPTGAFRGGHELVLRWYYHSKHYLYPDTYEFIQSWGEGEGDKGLVRMKADGFRYVFLHLNGDLCSPQEAKRAKR
jgi:hypothetical protein